MIIFPVEVPYAMRPHMRPWTPSEPILTRDRDFDLYQRAKIENYDAIYGDSVSPKLVLDAVSALRKYDPNTPDLQGDGLVWQLTRALQEDFVIWAPNRAGDLSAQILSVCLPSGWDPRDKVNKTFLEIHEPIPDFDVVNKASTHIAKMITEKGPFVRHVWTICNRPGLCRRPDLCEPWTTETLQDMWFRVERQVTIPIEGQAALFLIRVYMYRLIDVFRDQHKAQQVMDSINSMTDAVLDYKNLKYVRDYFLNQRAA